MRKNSIIIFFNKILPNICILFSGIISVIFSVLYYNSFTYGIIKEKILFFSIITVTIITILTILTLISSYFDKKIIYKILITSIIILTISFIILYIFSITGIYKKLRNVDYLREYISSFGVFSKIVFIVIQFLQVVILPIPSFITVACGVLLFGAFNCAILSSIGIILGSIVAFLLGRIFGTKIAKFIVGEKGLQKGLDLIKGKDKIALTFMFLFPFFPDDILCFVAGITKIDKKFFFIMIFITRIISIFCSSFSINNDIIPFNTWWGILIWILFFILTFVLSILISKYGSILQNKFIKNNTKNQTKIR